MPATILERAEEASRQLPGRLDGPLAWDGNDFADVSTYTVKLTLDDLDAVSNGLKSCQALGLHPGDINTANFPVSPDLQEKLRRCTLALHEGRGFCIIRGLGSGYSAQEGLLLFLGLGSYIGDKRGLQNKDGHMLSHITESKKWDNQVSRDRRHGIHSNRQLPFHNDMGADILALQVRSVAAVGGSTYISSATTVYNDLMYRDPSGSLLQTLLTPDWPVQISSGDVQESSATVRARTLLNPNGTAPAKKRHVLSPIMKNHNGHLIISVDPARLGPQAKTSAASTVPELTAVQREALDALAESAEKNQLRLDMQAGDLVFINNWALLHSRDAYVDVDGDESPGTGEGGKARRHLVRMWLRSSEMGWDIPADMSVPWLAANGRHDGVEELYPVEPVEKYPNVKYTAGSASFVLED